MYDILIVDNITWSVTHSLLVCQAQGQLLESLQGLPHIIKLIGRGTCNYLSRDWNAILISPFVQRLHQSDSLRLVAQVRLGLMLHMGLVCVLQWEESSTLRLAPCEAVVELLLFDHTLCRRWCGM
jgi:hypothetical protein